jgi:hypothetical protein
MWETCPRTPSNMVAAPNGKLYPASGVTACRPKVEKATVNDYHRMAENPENDIHLNTTKRYRIDAEKVPCAYRLLIIDPFLDY